jgi:trk system potassium uptake protein TrkH
MAQQPRDAKSSRWRWRRIDPVRGASRLAILAFVGFEFALEAGAEPGAWSRWLLAGAVAAAFAVELARDGWAFRRQLLRHRWPDLLLGLPGFALLFSGSPRAGAAFFVARLATRELTALVHWRPARPALDALLHRPIALLCVSFLLTIAVGTIVLLAPAATAAGRTTGFVTALFIATSATCVTGLADVDVAGHFTRFGHWAILVLMQVGGLGIMSLTTALALVFRRALSARARGAMQEILDEETVTGFRRLIVSIAAITVAVEAVGALALYSALSRGAGGQQLAAGDRAFHSAFHAVSAFCNAGFSLYSDSFGQFRGSLSVNLVVMALVVLGGIGFPVLTELLRVGRWWRRGLRGGWAFLPVHARVALVTTAALLGVGAVAFLALEWNHTLHPLSLGERLLASAFQSVTLRTAGFSTVDFSLLGTPMLLVCLALMFIGGSPGGTAGGVKTTTVAVLALTFRAMLRQRAEVEVFGRSVPPANVYRAAAVAVISLMLLFALTFLLFAAEPAQPFRSLLFEAVSAFGTVGLSLGTTSSLGPAGKLVICALMFVGRLGPFTLALAAALSKDQAGYAYPSTKIVVG